MTGYEKIVGAGSVVTRDIPDEVVWLAIPQRSSKGQTRLNKIHFEKDSIIRCGVCLGADLLRNETE